MNRGAADSRKFLSSQHEELDISPPPKHAFQDLSFLQPDQASIRVSPKANVFTRNVIVLANSSTIEELNRSEALVNPKSAPPPAVE